MIYQERFTESEIQAVNTLIKECNWATGTDDYLVAYMKLPFRSLHIRDIQQQPD